MWYFPQTTETFASPLFPAEVVKRLAAHTGPPMLWSTLFRRRPATFFRGQVAGARFDILRNAQGRSASLPVITGRVEAAESGAGSIVRINHRLRPLTFIVAGLWLVSSSKMLWDVVQGWLDSGLFQLFDAFSVAPLALWVVLFVYPFWREVGKSRPYLTQLLLLTPLEPSRSGPAS